MPTSVFDVNDVHTNEALEGVSIRYRNRATIWRDVAPLVPVSNRSDLYYTFAKETDFNRLDDATAPNADANEIRLRLSTDNYSVVDRALGAWVPVETIENADDPIRPEARAVENIREQLENNQEKRVADLVFAAATYPAAQKTTLSGTSQWSDASSDPINAILTQIEALITRPNTLVLGSEVWLQLRQHAKVTAAIFPMGGNAATSGVPVTTQALADLLDLDRVVIGQRRLNTAAPNATPVYSRIWGKHALLCTVNPRPTIDSVSTAYVFSESQSNVVRDFDAKKGVKGSVYVKDGWNETVKMVATDTAFFWENATA